VAAYDVDIQLAVKNLNTIKALKKELDAVEQALERISKLDTFDSSGFRARSKARQDEKNQVKEQIRLTGDLKKAESARRADLLRGVRLERQQRAQAIQQEAIQLEEKLFNLAKERLHLQTQFNNKTEEGNRKARQATADFIRRQRILKQGLTQHASPIGPDVALRSHKEAQQRAVETEVSLRKAVDAVNMKYDLRLQQTKRNGAERRKAMQIVDREIDFEKRLNKVLERRANITKNQNKQRSTKPVSSQQRFGSAVSAGAFPLLFGGGPGMALGGALGGAVSGSTFGPMSIALQVLGGGFDQLAAKAASLGAALNPATADVDAIVESLGLVGHPTQDAINSLEELAGKQVALEAATSQLALVVGDEGVEALTAFGDASTQFANALTKITTQVLAQIARLTGPIVAEIAKTMEIGALLNEAKVSTDPRQIKLQEKLAATSVKAGTKGMPSMERVRIETDMVKLQRKIRAEEEAQLEAKVEKARAGSAEHVIAKNNLAISKLEGDLTNTRIFNLEKANIMQEAISKKAKEGADTKLIDIERETKLQDLANKRDDQIEAANKKANSAATRTQKNADRLAKKKERAIERAIKGADRELERADKAFDRANDQLDKVIQKNEDKVAFEREYAELINNGSTPAAAKQAVELKKQQLELDRNFKKLEEQLVLQLEVAKAAILTAKARGASGTELDALNKDLADLLNKIDSLPGKKEDAEGAITAALAPKSERQELLDYLTELQGQINDMMSPVQQIIGLSETLGGAFSESFKGIVSGSMTAREALANLFQRTADHFLDMAAQMIAAQIKMQAVNLFMSFFPGGGGHNAMNTKSLNLIEQYSGIGANTDVSGFTPRANGGSVTAGRPYLVGERGPEMFVPGAQGNIVPNNAMGGGASVTVNVDASGSSVEGSGDQAAQLGKAIGIAVQQELIKQKRPGGLLTS